MKIFVSWSGDISHSIAVIIKEWLPVVLPYAQPWVSSKDIPKGSRWGHELASELETTNCGVICLTPANIEEPWINFEAGALSKTVQKAHVHPLLFGVTPKELGGPLSQFQVTQFNYDDLLKLIQDINADAGTVALTKEAVARNFKMCWPELEKGLTPLIEQAKKGANGTAIASLEKNTTQTEDLSEEEIKILHAAANDNGDFLFPSQVASMLKIRPQRAQYFMEKLQDMGLLDASYNYIHGTSWALSSGGRAELVKRKLL